MVSQAIPMKYLGDESDGNKDFLTPPETPLHSTSLPEYEIRGNEDFPTAPETPPSLPENEIRKCPYNEN